jgi:general stress protein 26
MTTTAQYDNRTADLPKLAELIKDVRVAMLTTFPTATRGFGEPTRPHSRPMYTQTIEPEHFDGTLWFMTDSDSAKVHELAENSEVLITYAAPTKNRFVVVTGLARAEHNVEKARELWNIHAKGWWPEGPASNSLALIEVQVETAEYWDGPSSTSYFISLLKAVATGERVDPNTEHGTLKPR